MSPRSVEGKREREGNNRRFFPRRVQGEARMRWMGTLLKLSRCPGITCALPFPLRRMRNPSFILMRGFPPTPPLRGETRSSAAGLSSHSSSRASLRANRSLRIVPQPGSSAARGNFLPHRSTREFTAPAGSVRCSVSPPAVALLWLSACARRAVEASIWISSSTRSAYCRSPQAVRGHLMHSFRSVPR